MENQRASSWVLSLRHQTSGARTMVTVPASNLMEAVRKTDILGPGWAVTDVTELQNLAGDPDFLGEAEAQRIEVPDLTDMTPGEAVKAIRKASGLSQEEFGRAAFGIPAKTISSWENGGRIPAAYIVGLLKFLVEHGGCHREQDMTESQR